VLIANVPVVAVSATITEDGIVKAEPEEASPLIDPTAVSVTDAPPLGAGADNVTMQLPLVLEASVSGLHCSDETVAAEAVRVRDALCEDPL
jgi:hypothetical protein